MMLPCPHCLQNGPSSFSAQTLKLKSGMRARLARASAVCLVVFFLLQTHFVSLFHYITAIQH